MLNGITFDLTPRTGALKDFGEFTLVRVDTETQDQIWNVLVSTWHYLGIQKIIGPRIKYLIMLGKQPIGAISYHAGSLRLEQRDRFIGWNIEQRKENLHHVVSQNRFLLLPWIHIRYLASHILARSLKLMKSDWKERYGYEPYICETFVNSASYSGTCYRAAGWHYVGETKGYSKQGKTMVYHGDRKHIFVKVMNNHFLHRFQSLQPVRLTNSKSAL